MRVGICTLSGASTYRGKNANSDEIIAVKDLLKSKGIDCKILQNYKDKREEKEDETSFYYSDPNDFDKIIIMNGSINCFGGIVQEDTVYLFKFFKKATKPKFYYFFNDGLLKFVQLSKFLKTKKFEDVKPEDVYFDKPLTIISSFKDLNFAKEENSKEGIVEDAYFFDSAKMILFDGEDYKTRMVRNKGIFDIIYGGSARRNMRIKSFNEFFCSNLKTALYGNLDEKKLTGFKGEKFKKVKCTDVVSKNAEGKATCVLKEKHYNDSIITRRVYESMMAGCVVFFEEEYDSKHTISPFNEVYVKNRKELETNFAKIFGDPELKKKILDWQLKFLENSASVDLAQTLVDCLK